LVLDLDCQPAQVGRRAGATWAEDRPGLRYRDRCLAKVSRLVLDLDCQPAQVGRRAGATWAEDRPGLRYRDR
ncbi:hypothetical protein VS872_22585, partial [Salmonella enterica subsp. enterica serovar Paratyphi A]|nr:hypothetical protein [Salmonella enterica subsp. enterica serovar Paratyphi A]